MVNLRTKMFRAEVKTVDEANGLVEACLSAESKDRDGDIIRQDGWDLADFAKNPVLVSSHDYGFRGGLFSQIGEWHDVGVKGKKLIGTAEYYIGKGNAEADWGFELARRGRAAYSVGFIPGDFKMLKEGGIEFVAGHKLLECSQVVVPANQDALQRMAKAFKAMPDHPLAGILADMEKAGDIPVTKDGGRCCVVGCDDMASAEVAICPEHLLILVMADGEPLGEMGQMMLRSLRKDGRVLSTANLDRLHGVMSSLKQIHDNACSDDECDQRAKAVVAEPEPAPAPEPETKADPEPEPEVTPPVDVDEAIRAFVRGFAAGVRE